MDLAESHGGCRARSVQIRRGPTMTETVSSQDRSGLLRVVRIAGLVLAGTALASLMIGWAALLLWLGAEAVITVVHWI